MKNYSIKNIKSFKNEASIEIKPITIFVGKNSCGKSSLIRFPVVIAQSMNSDADIPLMFLGKNLDYGNYEDVVFNHHKKEEIEFSVEYECIPRLFYYGTPRDHKYYDLMTNIKSVCFRISLIKYSRKMIINKCNIEIDNNCCICIERLQKEKYSIKLYDMNDRQIQYNIYPKHLMFYKFIPIITIDSYFDSLFEAFCDNEKIDENDRKELKNNYKKIADSTYYFNKNEYEFSNEIEQKFYDFIQLINVYSNILLSYRSYAMQFSDNTYYIGPFRENPSRVYRDAERQIHSVGARGEDVSTMLKADFSHGKKVVSKVSNWFEKSMNYKLSLKDIGSGLYKIVVEKEDGNQDNIIDVGYGISQVLPIVTQLIKMRTVTNKKLVRLRNCNNSLLVIEQPELHLHPGAQAELATLFVDTVLQNDSYNSINVLIETHSEHFIRKLQALIADKNNKITNDDVKIYYVDKNDNNEAFVSEMKIDSNGQFKSEWPSGFFDKAYELSMELLKNNIN